MLEIRTINDFQNLGGAHQQEILKAVRTKDRLDAYLMSLNKKVKIEPHWRPCSCDQGKCKKCHPQHPGWRWWEPKERDNSDIHPSQIDKCLKYLVMCCAGFAEQHEEQVNPQLRMIFDIGHAWHETIQNYGLKGAFCEPQFYRPEVPIDPDQVTHDGHPALPIAHQYWIRGSADAVIDRYEISTPGLGPVALRLIHEYKTINASNYGKLTRPKPEHKKQATIYSAVFDVPLVVYLYTNKDNCQTADFPVPFDNSIWAEIVQKIDKVQSYVNTEQPVPWNETSAQIAPTECMNCGLRKVCNPPLTRRV